MKVTITPEKAWEIAKDILAEIRALQADGELPKTINSFGQLHDHMDANVDWNNKEVESLPIDDWFWVQDIVHKMLEVGIDAPRLPIVEVEDIEGDVITVDIFEDEVPRYEIKISGEDGHRSVVLFADEIAKIADALSALNVPAGN